ncbi:MAG TPA: regulatory protein GemA [Stellaceae bacterium]|nr:regulatory protein GemA [Stellaceae bacterium]
MATITKRQIALIHVAKAALRLDDDSYRDVLSRDGGVASSRDLSQAGFDAVMATLRRLGFDDTGRGGTPTEFGVRPGFTSPSQVALMRALFSEYKGAPQDDAALGRWLHRFFKVSSIRFLSYADARRVIGTLKTMKARKRQKASERAEEKAPA